MLIVKRLVCVGLLISAFGLPTSAFANTSTDSSSQSDSTTLKSQFEAFLGNGGYISTSGGNQVKFSDWWSQHKDECPTQDSYEIWQQYYCGDFPGLGWGVGGNTQNPEGEGQFPGQGNGYGWQKWDAGH